MVTEKSRSLTVLALLAAISFLLFGRFLDNFFVYDDFYTLGLTLEGPLSIFRGCDFVLPRIVPNSLRWPLHLLSGNDPFGYNLFSVVLYVGNGFLFYVFVRELCRERVPAVMAAVLFVSSAVSADVVLWKAAYYGLMNCAFYLATLLLYLRYRKSGLPRYYWLSVPVFLLAVFSKEESASLPFVIVALELIVRGNRSMADIARKVVPYCMAIFSYLIVNHLLVHYLFHSASESGLYAGFHPLHTLLAPWTAFFLDPGGHLSLRDPMLWLAAVLLPLAVIFTGNRKLLLFGLAWVFVTFIPQSLASSPESFQVKLIMHSLSRYLYLPAAGVALVYALLLARLWNRMIWGRAACVLLLAAWVALNYPRVQQRGAEWREQGVPMRTLLGELKKAVPVFPPYSYVTAVRRTLPTERNFFEQGLRSFYNNRTLYYIYKPDSFVPLPGMTVYTLDLRWFSPTELQLGVDSRRY